MTAFTPTACVTLTQSLRAMEIVTDANVKNLHAAGMTTSALAVVAISDNAVAATLQLAAAVRAAIDGDLEPARIALRDLRLDQVEIR